MAPRRRAFAVPAASRAAAAALILLTGPAAGAELVAPYVTSPREDVALALELADVGRGDYLIDLGSGDGRIVIGAARRGAIGQGVELDAELVALSRRNAVAAGVAGRVVFQQGNVFESDIGHASVVTLYLMPEANLRLRPKLLAELAPGSRVVSISFGMGDWRPDRRVEARVSGGVMLWVVPVRVEGRWSIRAAGERFELGIEQRFQKIQARLTRKGQALRVHEATVQGRRVALLAAAGDRTYGFSGRFDGRRMSGVVQIHGPGSSRVVPWLGERQPAQ